MTNYLYLFLIFLLCLIFFRNKKGGIRKTNTSFNEKNYSIFYQDKKTNDPDIMSSVLLVSDKYNLQGKPDYILRHNKKDIYIPVELKSGSIGEDTMPHTGDFLQLITYFILIEEEFGGKVDFGKLIYKDYMFIVKNDKKYKKQLLNTVKDMRQMIKTGKTKNFKCSFTQCKHCLCNNTVCEVNRKWIK